LGAASHFNPTIPHRFVGHPQNETFDKVAIQTATRSHPTPYSSKYVQTIKISRTSGATDHFNPSSYEVTGGPLILKFVVIFLRSPTTQREHDIVLDDTLFKKYAAYFWQGLS
jgi:hypothetical protein